MTPLQQAAKAARAKGLDLPPCPECFGSGERLTEECGHVEIVTCAACAGCGVDTSDPYALLGRVTCALHALDPAVAAFVRNTAGQWYVTVSHGVDYEDTEYHDGTPEGIAAAALKLYAQVTP